jgi:hypothetical protein
MQDVEDVGFSTQEIEKVSRLRDIFISDKNAAWYTEPMNWSEADDFAVQYFLGIPIHPIAQLELVDTKMWGTNNTFWYKVS